MKLKEMILFSKQSYIASKYCQIIIIYSALFACRVTEKIIILITFLYLLIIKII